MPEATENGRVPAEVRQRIEESARRLPSSLWAVITIWFCYLVAVPILWKRYGPAALALIPTVGTSVFSWLGLYRHELWHNYFPRIDNPRWFNLVSYLLFSDPQVYRMAHASHHKFVHTPRDLEFFCEDWETDRTNRRRQFLKELLLGNIAWELSCLLRLAKKGRATIKAGGVAAAKRVGLLLTIVWVCGLIEPGTRWLCLASYWLTVWAGSVMTRHNQWIEHLGIVGSGSLAERNLLTRNLSPDICAGWLFNLINHHDAQEHVYHHTEPRLNSRGVGGLELPAGARTVTPREYLRILAQHYRSL